MIRRNHIETVTRVGRQNLGSSYRLQPPVPQSQGYPRRLESDVAVDENYRATSSNKKYHQYKDWKDHHRNKIVRQTTISDPEPPLSELSPQSHPIPQQLSQEYQQELKLMINKEYASRRSTRPQSNPKGLNPQFNYLREHSSHNFQEEQEPPRPPLNHHTSQQNSNRKLPMADLSPKRPNYQSTRKQFSSSQRDTLPLRPQPSEFNPRLLSRPYQVRTQPIAEDYFSMPFQSQAPSLWEEKKRQKTDKRVTGKVERVGVDEEIEWGGRTGGAWRLQVRREVEGEVRGGGDRVSARLKEISSFNEEINQRIKGIIECFQSLKGKL